MLTYSLITYCLPPFCRHKWKRTKWLQKCHSWFPSQVAWCELNYFTFLVKENEQGENLLGNELLLSSYLYAQLSVKSYHQNNMLGEARISDGRRLKLVWNRWHLGSGKAFCNFKLQEAGITPVVMSGPLGHYTVNLECGQPMGNISLLKILSGL